MQTFTEAMRETAMRDEVRRLNRQTLSDLMREHGLFFRASDFPNWRPTSRVEGGIPGVAEGLTIIATDGLLGYFLRPDGEVLYGHIQHFSGEVRPLYSLPKERPIKEKADKPKRQNPVERALALLRSQVQKIGPDSQSGETPRESTRA